MNIADEILANPILRELSDLLEKQTAKGLVKYGHTVNPGEFTMDGWLEHIREELLDGLVYATILKQKFNESHQLQLNRENERLRKEVDEWKDSCNRNGRALEKAEESHKETLVLLRTSYERSNKFGEALKFYASKLNWDEYPIAVNDYGKIARKALEESK